MACSASKSDRVIQFKSVVIV